MTEARKTPVSWRFAGLRPVRSGHKARVPAELNRLDKQSLLRVFELEWGRVQTP
ncbi:MAG: hypothetical protein IAE77_00010 [Prosthecobacter sp.]|uniref:hypothetical protein n=1 Tax=Prosthecobacter sp. TaxID=1965333 RepID=UPI0019EE936F|nr:hypothetical protein [Prosthecobacter sp.]MBE2281822.1 hypothetical protein [Prosthecobacter sp.]